jgi:hypothetical protein
MVGHEVLDSQLKTDRFPFPSESHVIAEAFERELH